MPASEDDFLQRGDRGPDVRALQRDLASLGFDPGEADGIFGEKTEAAVMEFQNAYDLYDDGIVGAHVRDTLDEALDSPAIIRGRTLRRGLRGDDVRALQALLNDLDYDAGDADGIFGGQTVNAVIDFQRDHELSADGIVGPNTAEALLEQYDALQDQLDDDDEDDDEDDDDYDA